VGSLAAIPAGRRTKWFMLVVWLVVVAALGSMAGKLNGAEKNDSTSYLPAKAESTQVFKLQQRFYSAGRSFAVIVYERSDGVTQADRAHAQSDVAETYGRTVRSFHVRDERPRPGDGTPRIFARRELRRTPPPAQEPEASRTRSLAA
jgi:hypothetical protein